MGRLSGLGALTLVLLCASPDVTHGDQQLLESGTAYTFADLGWASDVILTPAAPTAIVRFQLPADAVQGDDTWYAAQLAYKWEGVPPVGEPAYFYGKWNDHAMYQLKVKRDSLAQPGQFLWSMVDGINGGSAGYEVTDKFSGRSTNYATIPSVTGGSNVLEVQLDVSLARGADIKVTVFRSSKIIASRWGPPHVVARGGAEVDNGRLTIDFKDENLGLTTPSLRGRVVVAYATGRPQVTDIQVPKSLGSGEARRVEATVPLERPEPRAAYLLLDWEVGRSPLRVWPVNDNRWWGVTAPDWSLPGAVVAMVVLWISVPAAARAIAGR